MSQDSELLNQLLDLPPERRASLARQILLSLEPEYVEDDTDEAWEAEIEARLAAVDRGESAPSDWRDAVGRIRQSLRPDSQQ